MSATRLHFLSSKISINSKQSLNDFASATALNRQHRFTEKNDVSDMTETFPKKVRNHIVEVILAQNIQRASWPAHSQYVVWFICVKKISSLIAVLDHVVRPMSNLRNA